MMNGSVTVNGNNKRTEEQPLTIKHYNPVNVTMGEAVGTIMLGLVALFLLIALLRSQARNRKLLQRLDGEG